MKHFVSKKLCDLVPGDLRQWGFQYDFKFIMFVSAKCVTTDTPQVVITYLHANGTLFNIAYDESHFTSESCAIIKWVQRE
jgi:hypothetical protein